MELLIQLFALASFLQSTVNLCCFALKLPLVLIQRDIRWNKVSYIFPWEYMTRKVKIISINISIKYTGLENTENLLGVKIHCQEK